MNEVWLKNLEGMLPLATHVDLMNAAQTLIREVRRLNGDASQGELANALVQSAERTLKHPLIRDALANPMYDQPAEGSLWNEFRNLELCVKAYKMHVIRPETKQ